MSFQAEMAETAAPVEPAPALIRAFGARRALAVGCIVVLTGAGWAYAALHVAPALLAGEAGQFGPGMSALGALAARSGLGGWLAALCGPFNAAPAASELGLVLAMWLAMTFAMMLPTAAPMLLTYAEIADTAAAKGERVASPLLLAAGYGAVWLGFAAAAAVLSLVLRPAGLLDDGMVLASRWLAGLVFVGAGAYQFSALKHACLHACQRPFPFFFANWTESGAGVFRLGLRQGVFCLGCCWAAMLVMFAVGLMNLVWMAALGIVMTIEKMTTGTRFSRAVGVGFIAIGAGLMLAAAGPLVSR
jgi:predicted metal-binding membrane protein